MTFLKIGFGDARNMLVPLGSQDTQFMKNTRHHLTNAK